MKSGKESRRLNGRCPNTNQTNGNSSHVRRRRGMVYACSVYSLIDRFLSKVGLRGTLNDYTKARLVVVMAHELNELILETPSL